MIGYSFFSIKYQYYSFNRLLIFYSRGHNKKMGNGYNRFPRYILSLSKEWKEIFNLGRIGSPLLAVANIYKKSNYSNLLRTSYELVINRNELSFLRLTIKIS